MKIAVLDGYTLNPGDLSWDGLRDLGDAAIYDRTPADKIIERAGGREIVITNKTPITRESIDRLPNLRYIGVLATGYNVVDCEYAKAKNIPVTNIPAYGTASVAQFVFALLLELCHRAGGHSRSVFKGEWAESADFCYWKSPQIELFGKTMGIVGLGKIGLQTARAAAAFGMKIIACARSRGPVPEDLDFEWKTRDEVFALADAVSLHCPLFPETQGIVNLQTLSKMKRTAFLINTARGGLVVEKDLARALNAGMIAGAGLDVLSVEPPSPDNPLLTAKNCVITPHIAWATREARARLMDIAVGNVRAFLAGRTVNAVNL
ncbi:MAG: D-2-hydroxyacid dehydrogenase [Clostridiales bacterium]|jgi:glycerate dehydrogenase|nr:D-2-hydroxyacid dehydrogenase [Clostridiales bacterium]